MITLQEIEIIILLNFQK